jgi:hypothetical protein
LAEKEIFSVKDCKSWRKSLELFRLQSKAFSMSISMVKINFNDNYKKNKAVFKNEYSFLKLTKKYNSNIFKMT